MMIRFRDTVKLDTSITQLYMPFILFAWQLSRVGNSLQWRLDVNKPKSFIHAIHVCIWVQINP